MDFTRKSSPQTCHKTNIRHEDKDIISQLPDGILSFILSFLPTKDAVRTSVLSRRWKYIWTSLSNIDLNCSSSDKQRRNLFLNFVDRLLMLHDDTDIKNFNLILYGSVKAHCINSWVSAVVKHKCRELNLTLSEGCYTLPRCLFTCASLTALKIDIDSSILRVPTSVHLQNLKCLRLFNVTIGSHCSRLFSGCPVLQELILEYCVWENLKCLTIANSSLKSLSLTFHDELERELEIYASSLTSFQFTSFCKIDFSILLAPAIIHASVEMYTIGWRDYGYHTSKLLGALRNVKSLCINADALWDISRTESTLPVFDKLTHLEVSDGICCKKVNILVRFLQKMPNLESLFISKGSNLDRMEDPENFKLVTCGWRSTLKIFSISYFAQGEAEMHLLKFILENAEVLETVKIECLSSEMLESAREEVQMLPKYSESCSIIIS